MSAPDSVNVQLQAPSVVVVSPTAYIDHHTGTTRWGQYQFPHIRRLADGRIAVSYSLHADSYVSYGQENPVCVSSDGGRTWQEADAEDRRAWDAADALVFPDGEAIRMPVERPLPAGTLMLPPRPVPFTDGWGGTSDCYRLGDLPDELRRVKTLRRLPGRQDWVEEQVALDVPDLAVQVARMAGVEPDRTEDVNLLIRPHVSTEFFWTLTPDGGALTFQYLHFFNPDGSLPKRGAVAVLRSDDRGRSWRLWSVPGYFADAAAERDACLLYLEDPDSNYNRLWGGTDAAPVPNVDAWGCYEPGVVSFGDGRMLCVMRTDSGGTHQPVFLARSTDWGHTWTTPEILTPFGVMPKLVRLDNGVIALLYGRPGVQLLFCTDGTGERWHTPVNVIPEPGEKTRAPVAPSRGTVTTEVNAGWDDTCGNCTLLKTGSDRFLIAYSDFRHPGPDGKRHKAIKVQEITANRPEAI
jgi:hypothetical protein